MVQPFLASFMDFFFDEVAVDRSSPLKGRRDDEFGFVEHGDDKLQFLSHALAQVFHLFIPPALHFQPGKPFFYFGEMPFAG